MESRWIPIIAAAGWAALTLGIWGAAGRPWWIWPLAIGLALLGVAGAYGWAFVRVIASKPPAAPVAPPARPLPDEVRT